MRPDLYPMLLSLPKINATIRHFSESATDFHLAAFDGARMVGGIAAAVTPLHWFERCAAHVVMGRAVVPGVGRKLIAALKAWADNDMRIRSVQWPQEFHGDPRICRLLERYGFRQQVTTCIYYKGA